MDLDLPAGATAFQGRGPGALDPETASRIIAAAADIALVIDRQGIIADVAHGGADTARAGAWMGSAWIDTVTVESRPKVAEMLGGGTARWRQVNHAGVGGADLPIRYFVTDLGHRGERLAIGRDLSSSSRLQQRLLQAQQAMERDHMRSRQAETRYRALFDLSAEPVFIVESVKRRIVEANAAARRLAGASAGAGDLSGETFTTLVDPAEREQVIAVLGAVAAAEQVSPARVRLTGDRGEHLMSATLFRQERASFFLIRVAPLAPSAPAGPDHLFADMLARLPDAFVVTDMNLAILCENGAFLDMAEVARGADVRGLALGRFLGRPGIDLPVLVGEIRDHGAVRNFATIVRGSRGGEEEVEIAAVAAPDIDPPCMGFSIRSAARRAREVTAPPDLPRSVEQLTELVGRVPLKEIVRESTDLIERLCIEAALAYTADNRASAAEILGLSRQSLYSKLHRHGLGDLAETH